jgi:hypothetical protein
MTTHPAYWKAPQWHPDFGEPEIELRLLRAFSAQFLERFPEGGVELINVEEGYMHVELFVSGQMIGEVHIVQRGTGKPGRWYGVFLSQGKQEEQYFTAAKEGLDFIASACGARRGRKRAGRARPLKIACSYGASKLLSR